MWIVLLTLLVHANALAAKSSDAAVKLNSASSEARLEREVATMSLRKRLTSTRSHLQDIVLRVQDYTNKVEMGIRTKPNWNADECNELEMRLSRPKKKVQLALLSLREDLKNSKELSDVALKSGQQTVKDAEHSVDAATSIVAAMRKVDGKEALNQLETIRGAVDRLDQVLYSVIPQTAPKKKSSSPKKHFLVF